MIFRRFLLIALSCAFIPALMAQSSTIDSFKRVINSTLSDSVRAVHCISAGNYATNAGKLKDAEVFFRIGLAASGHSRNNSLIANAYTTVAAILSEEDFVDSSEFYLQKALSLFNKEQIKNKYHVQALCLEAHGLKGKGNHSLAFSKVQKALTMAEQLKDTVTIVGVYVTMADIYHAAYDSPKQKACLYKAIALERSINDYTYLSSALKSLSGNYSDGAVKFDSARRLAWEALSVSLNQQKSVIDESNAFNALGYYYKKSRNFDSMFYYFGKAKKIAVNNWMFMSIGKYSADAYLIQKKYKEALSEINSSLQIAKAYNYTSNLPRIYITKTRIYAAMGNYKEAYETHVLFHAVYDTMIGVNTKNKIAELETKYDLDKKDREIDLLAKNNKLNETKLANEKIIRLLLTAGICLVLFAALLAFNFYRKQKAANKKVSAQASELTLLMKELHHRVKNNLQIVSSLLSLQSFRVQDKIASEAIRDGQHRIEAMSLIHQKLYTQDDIARVNTSEFIIDIAESLMNAYGFTDEKFSLIVDVVDELIEVDKAIPLSLILNELLSNAFKYAYKNIVHPELQIRLTKKNEQLILIVSDNGVGIDIKQWQQKGGSFGKELVQTFTKQLNGTMEISVDSGTKFQLTIPVVPSKPRGYNGNL